jgi:hypothetical protein
MRIEGGWGVQSYADRFGEYRFVDCEKWRKEFGTDDLPRTFEYKEKEQVFEYYPQYYHKTDKVCYLSCLCSWWTSIPPRTSFRNQRPDR